METLLRYPYERGRSINNQCSEVASTTQNILPTEQTRQTPKPHIAITLTTRIERSNSSQIYQSQIESGPSAAIIRIKESLPFDA
jgi:hypothetical protein